MIVLISISINANDSNTDTDRTKKSNVFLKIFLCSLCLIIKFLSIRTGQQKERLVIIQMKVFYLDVKIKLLNVRWSRRAGGVPAQAKCLPASLLSIVWTFK